MPYFVAMVLALLLAAPAAAQVHVDIGIRLPAPPPLVVVPGHATVRYAPSASHNVFFYGDQYWIYADGGWFVSRHHGGPWIIVGPQFVPRPLLAVPVRYYHVPPGHWKQWHHQAPPRWSHEWGHEWAHKRQWKDNDHRDHHRHHVGHRGDHGHHHKHHKHVKHHGKGRDRD
jgi:hypothetical protein